MQKSFSDGLPVCFDITIYRGGRYSEVLGIEVQNIDFENLQVQFLNTKTEKIEQCQLTPI